MIALSFLSYIIYNKVIIAVILNISLSLSYFSSRCDQNVDQQAKSAFFSVFLNSTNDEKGRPTARPPHYQGSQGDQIMSPISDV